MLEDPRPRTMVSGLGGGAIMVIVTYALFVLHIDVPAPVVAAVTGVLAAAGAFLVHSKPLIEDREALHLWLLSRLGTRPAPIGIVPPSGPPVRPSPMGDVRP